MSKMALITGASRGIGAATAKLLALQGYDICVNYRVDTLAAQQVVDDVHALGQKAIAVQADIAQDADVLRLFEQTDQQLGTLTAMVNNAGILKPQSRVGLTA